MPLVRKFNDEQQIVTGEVYAPNTLDSWGDMMTREGIEAMAHRFMQHAQLGKTIDAQHDNVPRDAYPIESFIAREGDPDYTPGSWVLSVKINDPEVWEKVKRGDFNGFSFEAYVTKTNVVVMVETTPLRVIETEPDPEDGHTHLALVMVNEDGVVQEGRTSTSNGHSHLVKHGTATESAGDHSGRAHRHRIFL